MFSQKVLIIDDDFDLDATLKIFLMREGYEVLFALNGKEGMRKTYMFKPDIILLDLSLPESNGLEVCKKIRELDDIPIIIISGSSGSNDIVDCFECGADDFLTKPLNNIELLARIKTRIKTAINSKSGTLFDDGFLLVDYDKKIVFKGSDQINLTPTEFQVLWSLLKRCGEIVSHKEIINSVWGEASYENISNLSLYIHSLREKLETNPKDPVYIKNRWGFGYYFAGRDQHLEKLKDFNNSK